MHDVDAIAEALYAQDVFAHLSSRMPSSHEAPYHLSWFERGSEKSVRVADRQIFEARFQVRRGYRLGALVRVGLRAAVAFASSLGESGHHNLQRLSYCLGILTSDCD